MGCQMTAALGAPAPTAALSGAVAAGLGTAWQGQVRRGRVRLGMAGTTSGWCADLVIAIRVRFPDGAWLLRQEGLWARLGSAGQGLAGRGVARLGLARQGLQQEQQAAGA